MPPTRKSWDYAGNTLDEVVGWEAWFSADGVIIDYYSSDTHQISDLPNTNFQWANIYVKQKWIHNGVFQGYTGKFGCVVLTGYDVFDLPGGKRITGTLLTDEQYDAIGDIAKASHQARWESQS